LTLPTDDLTDTEPLHVVGVGAHPDDVGVGAAGVIASYVKRGHRATILSVTYGETVRPPGPAQEEAKRIRRREGEEIARKLGAEAVNLERPGNTIIPTWEMKALLVNALRRLQANVVLFPPPWDTHADHRNLSATMKDVLYYVGHRGMAFDEPPTSLRSAWMYSIESSTEELHAPDLLFDCTDVMQQKLDCLTGTRPIFGEENETSPFGTRETVKVWNRFWGMRCGVLYAEPLYQTWGSMRLAQLTRNHARVDVLPLIPA
jgi:LmbE family N-acetylglucosaminyl deacetylase